MAALKNRVERLEKEQRFQQWFHFERFLEGLTEEQLDDIVIYCRFPEPLPEPLPPGASRLDGLDRKSLNQRFEISERQTAGLMREMRGRNEDELRFHLRHDHWPEQHAVPVNVFRLSFSLMNKDPIWSNWRTVEQRALSSKNEGR
jgi:hypothetical protein